MKNKKGFTLIELLAVIVILAIIAVIAVPIVLNIIDNSKKEAVLRSAEFYLDAAEYAIANRVMNSGEIPNKVYQIMRDGNICLGELNNNGVCIGIEGRENNKDDILIVEVKGEKPKEGTIIIENGQIVKELKTELYLEKAELALANTPVGQYAIMSDGNICLGTLTNNACSGDVVVVEVNIAKPETGTISKTDSSVTISEESKNKTQLVINNHTVIRNEKNELEFYYKEKLCIANTTKVKALVYQNGDLSQVTSYVEEDVGLLASDEGAYVKGVAYTCNFGKTEDSKNLIFFVLSETEDTVTLISGANLGETVAWSEDRNNHKDEPEDKQALTAKAALAERIVNWSSVNGGKLNDIQMATIKLPTAYQIAEAMGKTFSGSGMSGLPKWLYSNAKSPNTNTLPPIAHGYWTSTPYARTVGSAWHVDYSGHINLISVAIGDSYGIRPIITLSKSDI